LKLRNIALLPVDHLLDVDEEVVQAVRVMIVLLGVLDADLQNARVPLEVVCADLELLVRLLVVLFQVRYPLQRLIDLLLIQVHLLTLLLNRKLLQLLRQQPITLSQLVVLLLE